MSEFHSISKNPMTDDEIDLKALFMVLWKGKLMITGITVIGMVLSAAYAFSLPDTYQSSALLAVKNADESGLSQIASQYGALANFAGVNLGHGVGNEAAIAIGTLRSRKFFKDNLYENILVELMAVKSWTSSSNVLALDPGVYNSKENRWVKGKDDSLPRKPSVQMSFSEFVNLVTISEDKLSGFVTISVEHVSPYVAKRWVDLMVEGINEALREKAIGEAERSIEYLTKQREITPLVDIDEIFAQLMEEQTKTVMLAYAAKEYVFEVIDPAFVNENKAGPKRAFICSLGAVLFGVLAVLILLIRDYRLADSRE